MVPGSSKDGKREALVFKQEEVDKLAKKVAEAIGADLLPYTPKMSKTMERQAKVTLVRTMSRMAPQGQPTIKSSKQR